MTTPVTAGFWSRLLAHCLDCLVGLAAWLLCSMWLVIGLWALQSPPRDLLDLALVLLATLALAPTLHVAYHVVLVGGCGQSLGKMALGIVVVRRDGRAVGYGRAVLRCLGGLLSVGSFGVGYAGVLFTAERRGLADWLAGTRVIVALAAPAAAAPGPVEIARSARERDRAQLLGAASATGAGSRGSSAPSRSLSVGRMSIAPPPS